MENKYVASNFAKDSNQLQLSQVYHHFSRKLWYKALLKITKAQGDRKYIYFKDRKCLESMKIYNLTYCL